MNDFTKEELEYMGSCIDAEIKYYGADHVGHEASNKIQSLIDNYCEPCQSTHEFYEQLACHHCGHTEDITV